MHERGANWCTCRLLLHIWWIRRLCTLVHLQTTRWDQIVYDVVGLVSYFFPLYFHVLIPLIRPLIRTFCFLFFFLFISCFLLVNKTLRWMLLDFVTKSLNYLMVGRASWFTMVLKLVLCWEMKALSYRENLWME